ncbi:MAG: hypothetical protein BJ554DRAFT_1228, partial [Olpidium bornovanus]
MEQALAEWFMASQDRVKHERNILDRLYPDHDPFEFSNRWLEALKLRHEIRSFRRFGESGSVDTAFVEEQRQKIKDVIDKFEWRDIYNMDETGLFYRMQ